MHAIVVTSNSAFPLVYGPYPNEAAAIAEVPALREKLIRIIGPESFESDGWDITVLPMREKV